MSNVRLFVAIPRTFKVMKEMLFFLVWLIVMSVMVFYVCEVMMQMKMRTKNVIMLLPAGLRTNCGLLILLMKKTVCKPGI